VDRLLGGLYRKFARDLGTRLDRHAALHIIDVGAGPGSLATALARTFPNSNVTAVDLDPSMAALAAARVDREALTGRVRVTLGDVGALPLSAGSVDVVTSSFSVHHWPDAAAGFAEVHRVLRPGGRAIIYDLPDWWGRFETHAPALLEGARSGGFNTIESGTVRWPGPLGVVQRIDATR
jgi:ubiquinone/menaquinone biosynthesis C-methylase UbiE